MPIPRLASPPKAELGRTPTVRYSWGKIGFSRGTKQPAQNCYALMTSPVVLVAPALGRSPSSQLPRPLMIALTEGKADGVLL